MERIEFEWHEEKNEINQKKHKVSFEEASTVFNDEMSVVILDKKHSEEEDRFLIIGSSSRLKVLTVCHCVRGKGDVIRLISARKATKKESDMYFSQGGIADV